MTGHPPYPHVLGQLLDLIQHSDDELSDEASIVLRFFFERHCLAGDATWLRGVERELDFQGNLAHAVSAPSIRDLRVNAQEVNAFAYAVFSRIELGVRHAWRHAYALKQAICVPGLQWKARFYLQRNWQLDEGVSLHLLNLVWETASPANFEETLADMSASAISQELRERALEKLHVMRELRD